jgi:hypothetical protein
VNRRTRLVVLAAISAMLFAAPAVVIAWRADRGSASFGDGEQVGRNRISSATVDIEPGSSTVPLRGEKLAPGDVTTGAIEVVNAGSVPVRYSITMTGAPAGEASELARWLTWEFSWADAGASCPSGAGRGTGPVSPGVVTIAGTEVVDRAALPVAGDPAEGLDPGDRELDVDGREVLCVVVSLSLDAPNEVQSSSFSQDFVVSAEQHVTSTAPGAPATTEATG